jgi:hypothetical protein
VWQDLPSPTPLVAKLNFIIFCKLFLLHFMLLKNNFLYFRNVFVILIVITKLTPLLYYLPWPSLASIVVYGVSKMFHFSEAVRLSQLRSFDFILWIVSFVSTLILGAMQGNLFFFLSLESTLLIPHC